MNYLFKIYILQNILIAISCIILIGISNTKNILKINSAFVLKMAYFAILNSIIAPIFFYLVNKTNFIPNTHQIWTPLQSNQIAFTSPLNNGIYEISDSISHQKNAGIFILIVVFIYVLYRYLRDVVKIKKILQNSYQFRKNGAVKLLLNEHVRIPFSVRFFNKFFVVIPYLFLNNHEKLRIVISHELQHHRQGDTVLVYIILICKLFFALNPFFFLFERKIYEFQELACDEALARNKKVSSHAYCHCLLWAAQFSLRGQNEFAGTANFLNPSATHFLKKRIHSMIYFKSKKNSKISSILLCLGVFSSLSFVAYAATSVTQEKKISMEMAQKMQKNANVNSEFPVVLNEQVLEQLNKFMGTESGREFIKQSLHNMKKYHAMIEKEFKNKKLPMELAAIPIVESGYKNIAQDKNPYSAGIWMFIPETARAMGLEVSPKNDERRSDTLETKAVAKLFTKLFEKYQDWNLAIMAYNYGSKNIDNLIEKASSHDAWKLIEFMSKEGGYAEPRSYLPSVMAAILIEKNPAYL
ncbi:MAG: transglycosylase SLT domain-containing protein [Bdellovibrionota bacterium]